MIAASQKITSRGKVGCGNPARCVIARKDQVPIVTTWKTPKMSSTVE